MSNLKEQIASAEKAMAKMKESHPYLFVEYARYKAAEQALEDAQAEYDVTKKTWDNFGGIQTTTPINKDLGERVRELEKREVSDLSQHFALSDNIVSLSRLAPQLADLAEQQQAQINRLVEALEEIQFLDGSTVESIYLDMKKLAQQALSDPKGETCEKYK